MVKYYVTRYRKKYGYSYHKIMQSLRSFHFSDYDSALNFFQSTDTSVYRVKLKAFDEITKEVRIIAEL